MLCACVAQCVALVESLECGLAASLESPVESPMLQSPSPACADLLYLSYRCPSLVRCDMCDGVAGIETPAALYAADVNRI